MADKPSHRAIRRELLPAEGAELRPRAGAERAAFRGALLVGMGSRS